MVLRIRRRKRTWTSGWKHGIHTHRLSLLALAIVSVFIVENLTIGRLWESSSTLVPSPEISQPVKSERESHLGNRGSQPGNSKSHKSVYECSLNNRIISIPRAPHFIVAGAQKCGTTALYEFLKENPNLQASPAPETHFFDWHYPSEGNRKNWLKERNFSEDLPEADFQCAVKQAYSAEFNVSSDTPPGTLFFEKTPSYLMLAKVPALIASTCPWKPKIVVILRNPIDRAFSHFRMKQNTNGKSFEDLIDQEVAHLRLTGLSHAPARTSDWERNTAGFAVPELSISELEEKHWKHYRRMFKDNFLQRGMYIAQLQHWMQFFPLGESLLVLNYERFRSNPDEVFANILSFVGAPPYVPAGGFDTEYNANRQAQQISNSTRQYLAMFFRPYNELLADTLGEAWKGVWD